MELIPTAVQAVQSDKTKLQVTADVTQSTPGSLTATIYQSDATQLKCTPSQTNEAALHATVYQPVAADLKTQAEITSCSYLTSTITTYPAMYQLTDSTTTLTVSGTTARVAIPAGPQRYVIKCSVDCFVQQGNSTVNATVAASFPLAAMEEFIVYWDGVRTTTQYIAAITGGAGGTLYIYPLKEA